MTESNHDTKPEATQENHFSVQSGSWANAWCLPQETFTSPEAEDRNTCEGLEESGRPPEEEPDAPDVAHYSPLQFMLFSKPRFSRYGLIL